MESRNNSRLIQMKTDLQQELELAVGRFNQLKGALAVIDELLKPQEEAVVELPVHE